MTRTCWSISTKSGSPGKNVAGRERPPTAGTTTFHSSLMIAKRLWMNAVPWVSTPTGSTPKGIPTLLAIGTSARQLSNSWGTKSRSCMSHWKVASQPLTKGLAVYAMKAGLLTKGFLPLKWVAFQPLTKGFIVDLFLGPSSSQLPCHPCQKGWLPAHPCILHVFF